MYKISEFSKITNLTVKALRYYDEENILKPSYRDEETLYRYYDGNDFRKARLIVMLRGLGFSIAEIRDVLANCDDPDDLSYYLQEKKSMIENRIVEEKALIRKISLYIQERKAADTGMDYKIEVKEFDPVVVASIRYKGKYQDVGNYIGKIYKAVKGKAAGASFNCYYDAEFKEDADIEICVPTTGLVHADGITAKKLPAVKAICTIHTGSYDRLNLAYKALLDHAKEHHINCLLPSREIYIKGPGMIFRGNENNYVTEIVIPFEEA